MKLLDNNVVFDVDETLIMHHTKKKDIYFVDPYDNIKRGFKKHKRHIKLLKDNKARGFTIIVWSANGHKWAIAVVKALKLEKYVDLTMAKPSKHVDDVSAKHILGPRIYLEDTP